MEALSLPLSPGASPARPNFLLHPPRLSSSSSSPPSLRCSPPGRGRSYYSIRPPPPEFDYKAAVLNDTQAAVAAAHPHLMDLVDAGRLVLVQKQRFGPVPIWRREFVEPEAIWLLGTCHLSDRSAADVDQVVRAVRPDNIVVELCRSRSGIMYASPDAQDAPVLNSNMFSLGGANFFGAINRSINLGGQSALALRLLLAVFSAKISSGANRTFGDEFRAARKVSEEIGAQLVLGDRPIEITLERAWNSLRWNEKLRLLLVLFRGITSASVGVPEEYLKGEEIGGNTFQLYEQLSISYPSLLQPLLHERDTYLAWSLKRSKAVNNSKEVVGVIGQGHMNGVVYALISGQGDLRFRDLVGRTSSESSGGWVGAVIKSLVRDTLISVALWAMYEQLKTVF